MISFEEIVPLCAEFVTLARGGSETRVLYRLTHAEVGRQREHAEQLWERHFAGLLARTIAVRNGRGHERIVMRHVGLRLDEQL